MDNTIMMTTLIIACMFGGMVYMMLCMKIRTNRSLTKINQNLQEVKESTDKMVKQYKY